jgi:UDP-N-acetylglucosamine 2-epimerase (non-hydrolysing)
MKKHVKIILVAGARPNFMKIAPIISAIKKFNNSINSSERKSQGARAQGVNEINPINPSNPSNSINPSNPINPINYLLVHTGQHYDVKMSETFFHELELPNPDINLEVGSSSHAAQTAEIMKRFEPVLMKEQPDVVVVVGDVNSTMACALTASKIVYPNPINPSNSSNPNRPLIAHVEAGLRSYDRSMPEEINRLVTDALSDLLFTPTEDADENLLKEGIPREKIKLVGNIMIDTLLANLDKARSKRTYTQYGLKEGNYVFVTLHRPSNVDDKISLSSIMGSLTGLSHKLPVIFPVHPRTKKFLNQFDLLSQVKNYPDMILSEPLGYHETIGLIEKARFVLTDSGGVQEETTFLGIPCLTLRPNTERPITIKQGTNKLTSLQTLEQDFDYMLNGYHPSGRIPELWDGKTAERIIQTLLLEYT